MGFNYQRAIKKIIAEELKANNPVPDILSYFNLKPLYEDKLFEVLTQMFSEYNSESQSPQQLLRIDVPKPNFTIRPMSRPENKDWILFEAIVDFIATKIVKDTHICKRSYSFLNFKAETEKKNNWTVFDDKCRALYTAGYKYAVIADLTGYYENISLTELIRRLGNYLEDNDENKQVVSVLIKMLNKWSDERVSGYGLPQGPPASSFLADIYLDYVDCNMEIYDNYYRYMDDIRIFCKTEIEAKKALKDLIIALRGIKLNINAKKTRILFDKDIEKQLFDPLKTTINLIHSIMQTKDVNQIKRIIPALTKMFEGSFLEDPFEKSHLNFSLYRLSNLQSSGLRIDAKKIKSLIINNFISKPHHTGLFCYFLMLFPNDKDISKLLIDFIKSENNIYEWQEVKVLQCLLRFKVDLSPQVIKYFFEAAKNSNKHFAVYESRT